MFCWRNGRAALLPRRDLKRIFPASGKALPFGDKHRGQFSDEGSEKPSRGQRLLDGPV
jgi:hypothetical protein